MEEYWKVDGTRERYSLFRDDAEIGRIDLRFSEESETMPRTRALRIDQNISLEYLIKAVQVYFFIIVLLLSLLAGMHWF